MSSEVHRGGTSIYRKKIDTQKVYLMEDEVGTTRELGGGSQRQRVQPGLFFFDKSIESEPKLDEICWELGENNKKEKSVQHPVFPSGRPPQY